MLSKPQMLWKMEGIIMFFKAIMKYVATEEKDKIMDSIEFNI